MTQKELFDTILKADLIPVPVNREGDAEETINYFDGNLNGFLKVAKSLGATAIFVMAHEFEENIFLSTNDDDQDDDEDTEKEASHEEEVDLSKFSPALAKYKKRLGEVYAFFLIAKGGAAEDLSFIFDQDWLADFYNELERAEGMAALARYKSRS